MPHREGHSPSAASARGPMTTIEDAALPDASTVAPRGARRPMRIIGPIVVALALLTSLATFLVLVGFTPIAPSHYVVKYLLAHNAFAVLGLLVIVVREVWPILQARRRGQAGARLHVRIVGRFSLIAAVPAILVAVVAGVTLDRGLDQMLSARDPIASSLVIAEIYVREQLRVLRGDTLAMAINLTQAKPLFDQDRDRFRQLFTAQASLRGVSGAMLLRGDKTPILKSDFNPQPEPLLPPNDTLDQASDTEPRVTLPTQTNLMVSIIRLRGYDDTYLYLTRPIDPRVLAIGAKASETVERYEELRER